MRIAACTAAPEPIVTDAESPRLPLPLLLLLLVRLRCLVCAARCAECFHCTVCSVFLFFLFFPISPPLHLRQNCGSLSSSRACSAALLAARQIRRRPRAVRMCGPLSTRIHQAFFHHVICIFDTSFSSCIEFTSFLGSTHSFCVVVSSSSSCPFCSSTSLSSLHSS